MPTKIPQKALININGYLTIECQGKNVDIK